MATNLKSESSQSPYRMSYFTWAIINPVTMDTREPYAAIKRLYYWKGMRTHILHYCKSCKTCAVQKVQKTQFEKQIFEPGVQPMEFVSMDLIGKFHPPSSRGNRYALTAVCMLTGYTFCIPIKNKTAQEIATAWRNHIAFPFGVLQKTTDG